MHAGHAPRGAQTQADNQAALPYQAAAKTKQAGRQPSLLPPGSNRRSGRPTVKLAGALCSSASYRGRGGALHHGRAPHHAALGGFRAPWRRPKRAWRAPHASKETVSHRGALGRRGAVPPGHGVVLFDVAGERDVVHERAVAAGDARVHRGEVAVEILCYHLERHFELPEGQLACLRALALHTHA